MSGPKVRLWPPRTVSVTVPFLRFGWDSQVGQYPADGPAGISYFRGEISPTEWVDCLLWRDSRGQLLGILNHFPIALPPEEPGNFTVFVRADAQRRGIGRALVEEAIRRWDVKLLEQAYTPSGAALINSILAA